jgi:PAS domain S-box-containing protein
MAFYLIVAIISIVWIIREYNQFTRRHRDEQKYRMLIDGLSEAYFEMDRNGNVLFLDGAVSDIFFTEVNQAKNIGIQELLTDNSKEKFSDLLTEIIDTHTPKRDIRLSYFNGDGSIKYVLCTLFPINGPSGALKRIAGVFQDITLQVNLEQSLKENEQRYRSLFDYNPKAVFSFDLMGNFTATNPVCEDYTGYSASEFANLSFEDITMAEDLAKTKLHFEKAANGVPQNYETRVIRKNNEILDVEVTNIPILVDGVVIGVYGISDDITEYKRTQEFLRRSEKLTVVGELAAGMAHEIRNPLTPMKGFVQLLQQSESTNDKRYLDIILSETLRIEKIINQYLSFARAEIAIFKDIDLSELLVQVIQLLTPQATMNNVEILLNCQSCIPPIEGDKSQLEQVFVNLLKNSIESMPNGGEILLNAYSATSGQISIQVIDHGNGIPSDRIAKLGEPFYTTKEKGTGLGLMTCYKIIGNHNGRIHIESTLGKGTNVTVKLPVKTRI